MILGLLFIMGKNYLTWASLNPESNQVQLQQAILALVAILALY